MVIFIECCMVVNCDFIDHDIESQEDQETSKCAMIRLTEAQHTLSLFITNQFTDFFFSQNSNQHEVQVHIALCFYDFECVLGRNLSECKTLIHTITYFNVLQF